MRVLAETSAMTVFCSYFWPFWTQQTSLCLAILLPILLPASIWCVFFAGSHQREEELVQSGVERADRLHRDVSASLSEDQDPGKNERHPSGNCHSGASVCLLKEFRLSLQTWGKFFAEITAHCVSDICPTQNTPYERFSTSSCCFGTLRKCAGTLTI